MNNKVKTLLLKISGFVIIQLRKMSKFEAKKKIII